MSSGRLVVFIPVDKKTCCGTFYKKKTGLFVEPSCNWGVFWVVRSFTGPRERKRKTIMDLWVSQGRERERGGKSARGRMERKSGVFADPREHSATVACHQTWSIICWRFKWNMQIKCPARANEQTQAKQEREEGKGRKDEEKQRGNGRRGGRGEVLNSR